MDDIIDGIITFFYNNWVIIGFVIAMIVLLNNLEVVKIIL